jgi:endonuclease-3
VPRRHPFGESRRPAVTAGDAGLAPGGAIGDNRGSPGPAPPPILSPKNIRTLFERLQAADPNPRSELEYGTPFQLLTAVILSAQATDKGVNLATRRLFPLAPTPEAMVALGEEGLAELIRTIGLYRTKARNVIAMARLLLERHGGEVPDFREALEALPGVGRKTANVVLNVAFGQPTIAVDTHIFRVANRTGLAPGKNVGEVEAKLLRAVPKAFRLHAHHWLILHGRYVCKAQRPACERCTIRDLCEYPDKRA